MVAVVECRENRMVALAQLVFAASLLGAAAFDLGWRRIPDVLSAGIVAAFAVAALSQVIGAGALTWHVAAGVLVFAGGAALFFAGVIGGGDVKLMAAAALWIGWQDLPRFLVLVALLGGVLGVIVLAARRILRNGTAPWLRRAIDNEEGLPYAVAIAGAALLVGLPAPLTQV
jgi:prepilin peptidase CpaA